jgi:hypothetical protein
MKTDMMETIKKHLHDAYGHILQAAYCDERGKINETWFIDNEHVLTIFCKRDFSQIQKIAYLSINSGHGLFPKAVEGNNGHVSILNDKPCILWNRIHGKHFVGLDESKKAAIPFPAHKNIAESFWKVHKGLASYKSLGESLGSINYAENMNTTQQEINFTNLPDYLQRDFIDEYLHAASLPLKYPALIHSDMERHNLLHRSNGEVAGVVDLDSILMGDLFFEYAHFMMNFVLTDPSCEPRLIKIYIAALIDSKMIAPDDLALLPLLVRLFAAEDLIFYHKNPRPINLSLLSNLYQTAIEKIEQYFIRHH